MTMEQAKKASYHRQVDAGENSHPAKYLKYIAGHDRAKKIMEQDYHLLPQRSNKEKCIIIRRERERQGKYQTGLEPVCGAGSTTGRLSKTVVLLISKEFMRDVFIVHNTSPQKLCGLAFSIPVQFRYKYIKYASDSQGESYTG